MPTFYPPYLRERFTDRAHELSVLASVVQDLQEGRPRHMALFGLRRIGKTLLAQEQVVRLLDQGDVAPVYLDMEGVCSAPEPFAQRYVGLTCYWVLAGGKGPVEPFLTADRLLETEEAGMVGAGQRLQGGGQAAARHSDRARAEAAASSVPAGGTPRMSSVRPVDGAGAVAAGRVGGDSYSTEWQCLIIRCPRSARAEEFHLCQIEG